MPRLPFLLAIVHGGTTLPRELTPRLAVSPGAVFYDSNPWTREVFSMGEQVQGRQEVDIARVVVDLDVDPKMKKASNCADGGIIKKVTRYNKPVWLEGQEPNEEERSRLIDRYHHNWHGILERVASRGGVRMGIDCHSMAPIGAPLDDDAGCVRPMFCVGNLGDENGEGEQVSCDPAYVRAFVECIEQEFADLELPEGCKLVTVNNPLPGGYLLYHHGIERGNTPWLLFAFNRRLLVPDEAPEAVDSDDVPDVPREAIAKLRVRIFTAMLAFARRMPDIMDDIERRSR
ncbi:N-formylglutamate amidohydrolase, partial [bacterium]|nr:N-formylglutamate amidohydrolase [bacterium]